MSSPVSTPTPIPDADDDLIQSFNRPNIVQQKSRVKMNPSYVLRGIQADEIQRKPLLLQAPGRSVDLEWLDGCLAEGRTPAATTSEDQEERPSPSRFQGPPPASCRAQSDDEDILDPSDDEGIGRRETRTAGRKRKDPDGAAEGPNKRMRITEPGIVPDEPILLAPPPPSTRAAAAPAPDVADFSSNSKAAKSERLAKYENHKFRVLSAVIIGVVLFFVGKWLREQPIKTLCASI